MNIIKPYVELIHPIPDNVLQHIELCGRVCYKSEDKITEDSAERFVKGLIARGHESVLEHYSVSIRMACDRGVSHELIRHRIASYSQESTRYVRYGNKTGGVTYIEPCFLDPKSPGYTAWKVACQFAEIQYQAMLDNGCTPQEARAVLPNSLKTEVVVTMNLRAWRHFFSLRLDTSAHPQMREVAQIALDILSEHIAVVFDEFKPKNRVLEA